MECSDRVFFEKLREERLKSRKDTVYTQIWKEFFSHAVDSLPTYSSSFELSLGRIDAKEVVEHIREWYFSNETEWFDIYDFIEFIADISERINYYDFVHEINSVLERNLTAYRIVNTTITPVTSEVEIQAIEEALVSTDIWQLVNTHLKMALDLLSDRKNPDYRNSIKESISAVEALARIITGDTSDTLGKLLNKIKREHNIHEALISTFTKLYGYTAESGGIRHSLNDDDTEVTLDESRFMLVTCSAFINYLKAKLNIPPT